jgi:PAS domain S-box-containing protein
VTSENYLASELTHLVKSDDATWQFLQSGSLDGVWYWDLENPDQEWMSPEFWQVFGIDPTTKRHDPAEWQDIIFEDDLRTALKNFEAHCADPDHPYDQIVRYRHADGTTVWIRCRGLAIRDDTGKPIRMLGAHTDITPVKRSEENARAGWRAAETANAELKSFAYSVSHDMKAPTNTLKLLMNELGTLVGDQLDEDAQQVLQMSLQTVDRMQRLIEDVLDYTRIIGKPLVYEPVDLCSCVAAVMADLSADIAAKDADIFIGDMPIIKGLQSQMRVFFQNMITNALKFAKPGQKPHLRITSTLDTDNELLLISFADKGIGIAPHNHERIFTLFQRLHGHDEIAGTGIGLPMCQRIALNHLGDLTLDSSLGKGTTFTLALPWRPI